MKFIPCNKCKNQDHAGFIKLRNGAIQECDCHKTWRLTSQIKRSIVKSNLSVDILDKDWSTLKIDKSKNEIDKLKTLVKAFPNLHKFVLYIYGEAGCQKTTVAQLIGKDLLKQGFSVQYVTMKNLIDNLRGFSELEKEISSKYYDVDLLIIDECFDEKKLRFYQNATTNQTAEVDIFLRARGQLDKATILISNVLPQDIMINKFSQTCQDFVIRETVNKGAFIELKDNYAKLAQDLGQTFDLFSAAKKVIE